MYQPVHEEIEVIGVFAKGCFTPKKFLWNKRVINIEQITLSSLVKDGGVRNRFYSALNQGNLYRLNYNLDTQHWQLAEVWYEG